jgi:hypothetical protein
LVDGEEGDRDEDQENLPTTFLNPGVAGPSPRPRRKIRPGDQEERGVPMPEKVLTRMEIVWKEDKASPGKSTLIEYIARTSMAFRALVGQVLQMLGATLPSLRGSITAPNVIRRLDYGSNSYQPPSHLRNRVFSVFSDSL